MRGRDEQLQQRILQEIRAEVEDRNENAAGADGEEVRDEVRDEVPEDDQQQHHHQPQQQLQAGCNCEGGVPTCPMNGNCLVTNTVYSATVELWVSRSLMLNIYIDINVSLML